MKIGNREKMSLLLIPPRGHQGPGLPRSWKSHGFSGILKFSGISGKVIEFLLKVDRVKFSGIPGKVMEFLLKMDRIMEKSWNFKIGEKSWENHRKRTFFNFMSPLHTGILKRL